jgi:hypothetical protein
LIHWAGKTGEFTAKVVEQILVSRPHPEQGYRSCLGLMRLSKDFGEVRVEAARKRAFHLRAFSYRSVQSILKNKLDQLPLEVNEPEVVQGARGLDHRNVRGAAYYQQQEDLVLNDQPLN